MRSDLREAFHSQARACRDLGSPFYGMLAALLAERLAPTTALGRRIDGWSDRAVPDALALRVLGGLHALARSDRAPALRAVFPPSPTPSEAEVWSGVSSAIAEHDAFLTGYLDSPPQTNEVGRSAVLLGVALRLSAEHGLPLHWLELGASAGLNLGFDRYRYELGASSWGAASARVVVRAAWSGTLPPCDAPLVVARRAGCDVQPLDPGSAVDRARLLSYVWPDQEERLERIAAALAEAAAAPERVVRAAASTWLAAALSDPPVPGTLRVVAHTIVWQYLDAAERAALHATLDRAGADARSDTPLAWIAMEADGQQPGAALMLHTWPGDRVVPLGRADYHGRWVRWA